MSSRLPTLCRTLSTQASSPPPPARARPTVAGVRVDHLNYTDTGGSGRDASALSHSLPHASRNAVRLYRAALREMPHMINNYNIVEDGALVRSTIRELFERHASVTDAKIVDMLVFKGAQELNEIREQWKGRHHVYGYIVRHEQMLREQQQQQQQQQPQQPQQQLQLLDAWRARGVVPHQVLTWRMYQQWKQDEQHKFEAFALQHKLFTSEQLHRNAHASGSQCAIM